MKHVPVATKQISITEKTETELRPETTIRLCSPEKGRVAISIETDQAIVRARDEVLWQKPSGLNQRKRFVCTADDALGAYVTIGLVARFRPLHG